MPPKLSKDYINDVSLHNRNIKMIGEYTNTKIRTEFECLVCGYIWRCNYEEIQYQKHGCPCCAKKAPLTNESVDFRLRGRSIIRGEDVINGKTKIKWKCLIDSYEWSAEPNSVLSGKGCPKCAGNIALTNEDVDFRLLERSIKRMGDIVNARTKIKWKCLIDGHEWCSSPTNVLSRKSGCPLCAGTIPFTNDLVDERLQNRDIERIEDIFNNSSKILWKCKICSNIWKATGRDVVTTGTGCPNCKCKRKNETRVYNHLVKKYGDDSVKRHYNIFANNRRYEIDFVVNGIFIEYNGRQHYKSQKYFGGETAFVQQQKRDEEVRQYCKEHDIKLIEIPYNISHNKQYSMVENLHAEGIYNNDHI